MNRENFCRYGCQSRPGNDPYYSCICVLPVDHCEHGCAANCQLASDKFEQIGPVECCSCKGPPCFPSEARLSLDNGETIAMVDLKRGDRVKTGKVNVLVLIVY